MESVCPLIISKHHHQGQILWAVFLIVFLFVYVCLFLDLIFTCIFAISANRRSASRLLSHNVYDTERQPLLLAAVTDEESPIEKTYGAASFHV